MLRSTRSYGWLPLALLALVTTSCGAGGGGGGGRLSEDDFVEETDSICTAADEDLAAIEVGDPADLGDHADAYEEALQISREAFEELSDLNPPEVFASDYASDLGNIEETLSLLEDLQSAAQDGDGDEVAELWEVRYTDVVPCMTVTPPAASPRQ